jgi:hypothetical protein
MYDILALAFFSSSFFAAGLAGLGGADPLGAKKDRMSGMMMLMGRERGFQLESIVDL